MTLTFCRSRLLRCIQHKRTLEYEIPAARNEKIDRDPQEIEAAEMGLTNPTYTGCITRMDGAELAYNDVQF